MAAEITRLRQELVKWQTGKPLQSISEPMLDKPMPSMIEFGHREAQLVAKPE